MEKKHTEINQRLKRFIQQQKIFFVGTAAPEGRVNISPKGIDSFRILNERTVLWLNLTGSGNETASHLIESNRMTLMFCAFEGNPLILRLYGQARVFHPRDPEWKERITLFPKTPGSRQIIEMSVDLVQTSCGMGIPYFLFKEERDELNAWAEQKGEVGIRRYWKETNQISLDGKPTRIFGTNDED